jgi:hypothetical protein
MHPSCCSPEVKLFRDGDEIPELSKVHELQCNDQTVYEQLGWGGLVLSCKGRATLHECKSVLSEVRRVSSVEALAEAPFPTC